MSKRKRRTFSAEFKADAVQLVRSSNKSVKQVADDLGLHENVLAEWVKHAKGDPSRPSRSLAPREHETPEAENLRLREELRQARMERDFLKKAVAFFAKESE